MTEKHVFLNWILKNIVPGVLVGLFVTMPMWMLMLGLI